jgi:hypothetical protein
LKFLKKKNKTEPKSGQTDWFQFGSVRFFRAKTGSSRFGSVFLVFSGFGSVFFRFFQFRFSSVQFFWFSAYKTETKPVSFFKILICFFFRFGFFGYFFSGFLGLIGFSVFLLIPDRNAHPLRKGVFVVFNLFFNDIN